MPKNEDGEFELVVGNKQLMAVVIVLMALFGVVFAMGYMLGRGNATTETVAQSNPVPSPQGTRPEASGPLVSRAQPPADTPLQPGEAKVTTPDTAPPTTQPVSASAPDPQPASAAAAPQAERPKPAAPAKQPEPPPQVPPPAPKSAPPAAAGDVPAVGQTFLQVAAVKKPQAQLLVEVLKEKGFHAVMAQVDGQDVYRTLVGPLKDAADMARTKSGLENAGFKPFVKKY